MALSESQKELLRQVDNGERSFRAEDDSDESLKRFQPQAEELAELGQNGYLDGVKPHPESHSGHRYIDLVMVRGLTAKGRRALNE
jgi:hypothetical protein